MTLKHFISKAHEWYNVYHEITNIMQTKPFDKIKFLHYIHQLRTKVDLARNELMKCDQNVNKDKEWANAGLDCESFLLSVLVEYGLKNGITLEEITFNDNSDTCIEPGTYVEPDTCNEKEDIMDDTTKKDIPENTVEKDLIINNDFLKDTIQDALNKAHDNTIERHVSINMNKDKDDTIWYVTSRHVVTKPQYFSIEFIWLVISIVVSLFMGMRYLVTKKR